MVEERGRKGVTVFAAPEKKRKKDKLTRKESRWYGRDRFFNASTSTYLSIRIYFNTFFNDRPPDHFWTNPS